MRKLSVLLAAALLFGCVFTFEASAADELDYGKSKLAQMDRAEDYIGAYDAIYEAVENKEFFAELDDFGLNYDEFSMVYDLYLNDSGEHYYIDNRVNVYTGGGDVVRVGFGYLGGKFDEKAYGDAVAEYVSYAKDAKSEYEKALILHDALIKNVVYRDEGQAHNSYGALVNGTAVCEGYAEAYQVLLQEVGIMSYVVRGMGGGQRHAWNLVRLDGKFYYTDLTWDDPVVMNTDESTKPVFYAYFNVPDKYFKDHIADDDYGILPDCTNTDKMYADLAVIEIYTVENVAAAFKNIDGKATARIYYAGKGEDNFYPWLAANYMKLATELGINNISLSYMICGAEHYIQMSQPLPEHVYDDDCDTTCNVCGRTRKVPHNYGSEWSTSGKEHWHECSACGDKTDTALHTELNGKCIICERGLTVTQGDIDGKEGVAADDAIYLLYNVFFGEGSYPVYQSCDFDGSGVVDANDAIYLLYHVFFGGKSYPLH